MLLGKEEDEAQILKYMQMLQELKQNCEKRIKVAKTDQVSLKSV